MPDRHEPGGTLHRKLGFGSLAELSMLDPRSYRSEQVAAPLDPAIGGHLSRTITGDAQMRWLAAVSRTRRRSGSSSATR
ncbi:alkaline phosphatase D family protein [Saccharopolyspora halophila]|uniref:alkaline phosphatase D family protein n=1 Tax=Saccharopolyspora halophila TaxID=405551 RepID=UPI0031CDB5F6